MEAHAGAVDDLQPLALLHREVDQLGAVLQLSERLQTDSKIVSLADENQENGGCVERAGVCVVAP